MTELLVVCVIALAFFGEAIFGFGGGLISIPLLSLLIGVKDAVTLVLIFQLLMGILIWKTRRDINWRIAKPMTVSIVIGTVIGTLLLSNASVVFLQLFLAAAIILFLIKTFLLSGFVIKNTSSRATPAGVGLGGGLFQGLIGTGGPLLTMYLSVAIPRKEALRATLIYLFFVTSVVRVGLSASQQLFTTELVQLAALALPLFLLAIYAGQRVHRKITDHYYRLTINIILAGSALALILKALL